MLTRAEIYGSVFLRAILWAQYKMIFAHTNSIIKSPGPIYTASKCQQAKAVY